MSTEEQKQEENVDEKTEEVMGEVEDEATEADEQKEVEKAPTPREHKEPRQKSSTRFPEGAKKGERHWYAIHTYSGYEDAVLRYLKQRIDTLMMNDKIFNVIVPKEKKVKIKNGKRRVIEEKIYHGYVLVDMVMSEDSWYVVRNTPRVTGFVGADPTEPTPLSKEEVDAIMIRIKGDEPKFKIDFRVGDVVKIIDGPFKDYDGKVSGVDEEHGKIKVMVPIFGRETAVELDSLQVMKI